MSVKEGIRFGEDFSIGLIKGIDDKVPFKSKIRATLKHPDGSEEIFEFENTLTELGDALIADALSDRGVTLPSHMAVGTGTGQDAADTTLATELARVALDSTTQGTGASDNDVTWIATFAAGTGTGAITEAGLFNANPAGVMFSVTSFAVINKGAADILIFSWTLTCGLS